jgi:lactate dehydrogenase-like 2-hydroxyacid dehydrogenase
MLPHTAFYTETNVSEMVRSIFDAVDAFEKGIPSSHIIL